MKRDAIERDAIWHAVYGAFVVHLVAEFHRLTSEWPTDLDHYADISANAACVADSDAEARARAAQAAELEALP